MICTICNSEIPDSSKFCPICGIEVEVENLLPESTGVYRKNDRVYGVCNKVEKNFCYFGVEGDDSAFFCIPTTYFKNHKDYEVKTGMAVWAMIEDVGDGRKLTVKVISKQENQLFFDFNWFYERYSVGDYIYAPVTKVAENYVSINLSPNIIRYIQKNAFPDALLFDDYRVGNVEKFKIEFLEKNEEGKIEIGLVPCLRFVNENKLWSMIPETLKDIDVIISEKLFEYIDSEVLDSLLDGYERRKPQNLKTPISNIYERRYAEKEIFVEKGKDDSIQMNFDLDIRSDNGVPEEVYMKRKPGDKWVVSAIMPTKAERIMERYVYIPDKEAMIEEVANLCLAGDIWDYGNKDNGQKKILRNYLFFAFYKSRLDGLFTENEKGYIFNTGLVDNAYDDIYCFLEPNAGSDFMQRKWKFAYFACRGKGVKGKEINRLFSVFPKALSYIDNGRISDLYFDPEKEIFSDYDHILKDHVERLPYEFLQSKLSFDVRLNELFRKYNQAEEKNSKKAILGQIHAIIKNNDADGDRLRRELEIALKSAEETAKKYCRWNYKTAIPVYYAKNNSISLLLPLKLRHQNDVHADVALVVERLENGNYQGQTIYTLEMAYQDARQICRPNSDWLLPQDI